MGEWCTHRACRAVSSDTGDLLLSMGEWCRMTELGGDGAVMEALVLLSEAKEALKSVSAYVLAWAPGMLDCDARGVESLICADSNCRRAAQLRECSSFASLLALAG